MKRSCTTKSAIARLLIMLLAGAVAHGAELTFDWPDATQGRYRYYAPVDGWGPDSGYNSDQTLTFANSQTISIGYEGIGGATPAQIAIDADGNATLADAKGIGIVDDGGNSFRFVKAAQSLVVQSDSILWNELRRVDGSRKTGNQTYSLVYGPGFVLDRAGSYGSLSFGINAAGNVTLAADSPSFITATGNTIAIKSVQTRSTNTGPFLYQLGVLDSAGNQNGNSGNLTGVTTNNLTPGYFRVFVNAKQDAWLAITSDPFQVTEQFRIVNGIFSFTYYQQDSEGNPISGPYEWSIEVIVPPPSGTVITIR